MSIQKRGGDASVGGSSTLRSSAVLERTYRAPLEALWSLWTTKEGFESWWAPDGFQVLVHEIDAGQARDLAEPADQDRQGHVPGPVLPHQQLPGAGFALFPFRNSRSMGMSTSPCAAVHAVATI